jgi:hypothetical protein
MATPVFAAQIAINYKVTEALLPKTGNAYCIPALWSRRDGRIFGGLRGILDEFRGDLFDGHAGDGY